MPNTQMPMRTDNTSHWLDQYGSAEYQWRETWVQGRRRFYRPVGLVELSFDADGRYHEGCADMCSQLDVEIKSTLSRPALRERVLLALACLRCQHLLLQAKADFQSNLFPTRIGTASQTQVYFAIEAPGTAEQAVFDASQNTEFLDDHFDEIDAVDFWIHCQNTARVVDPSKCLSRFFVHPIEHAVHGRARMRFLMVAAHMIVDGLTNYFWQRDLVRYLNLSAVDLRRSLNELIRTQDVMKRLPPAQEALYPPITGSKARQRWFWILTRVLRHVRKPLPGGFQNPLRRSAVQSPLPLSPTYAAVLDYSRVPPLNTLPCFLKATLRNTDRLHALCRKANASIGAGCFALAALSMMEFYELREPDVPLLDRKPFIAGFPINPRPFFDHFTEPDSLMLAFCDGITLPFLPSCLDFDGRLRLLAKQAHRQLAAYQKRPNVPLGDAKKQYMSSRGAGRVIANQYLLSIERADAIVPKHLQKGVDPQGAYPRMFNMSLQTCGVSSVGRRDGIIRSGVFDLDDESKDFAADQRNVSATVRAREGEFLIGIGGADDGHWVNASIDASAIDPDLVEAWRDRFEHILDQPESPRRSKL